MTEEHTATTAAPPQGPPDQPWAARFGLVRPRHGRYVAGVCAALGRATTSDPLLWRVLIGVLSIFGIGIVIYVAGWLLMPAEGDTASPVEAMFGRGYSSTSSGLTLGLAIVAVILLGALTNSFIVAVIAAVGLVVAALAANPRNRQPLPVKPPHGEATEVIDTPSAGYQPPFAPHGPYAPPPLPVPPRFDKPKPERSRLGRLIFGLILIVLGGMSIADLAGYSVPFAAYVAASLAVIGVGLMVGAWFGRARGFILIGIMLSLILPVVADEDDRERTGRPGPVSWVPMNMGELSDHYSHRFGEATLDLSNLDFTGTERRVQVDMTFGDLKIILPPNVDVRVSADSNLGDVKMFDRSENVSSSSDDGVDGPGGGTLHLRLEVRFAAAEVTR